jgi:hypothetical protein
LGSIFNNVVWNLPLTGLSVEDSQYACRMQISLFADGRACGSTPIFSPTYSRRLSWVGEIPAYFVDSRCVHRAGPAKTPHPVNPKIQKNPRAERLPLALYEHTSPMVVTSQDVR